ncbi:MAG: VCBS repeat-containing protein [Pyrinomonadaceae bacterium]
MNDHINSRRFIAALLLFQILLICLNSASAQKPAPRWPMFRKHEIDSGANESVTIADVNNDGRQDIISGENWFMAPDWEKHRLREIPSLHGYVDDFSNFALDVNGDSFVDVIACSWFQKKLAWFENPGKSEPGSAERLWKEHIIETGFN